jgi:hypothetical protein
MATFFSKKIFWLVLVILLSYSNFSQGQKPIELKAEPGINLSWRYNDRWSFNSQVKANRLLWGNENSGFQTAFTERLEFQAFANYSVFGSKRLSVGYIAGLNDPFQATPSFEHRLVQQFSFTANPERLRLAIRLRAEQRFRESGFEQRYRARIGSEIPLQGDRLDQGEPYLVIQQELLASFSGGKLELGNRFYAGIGWLLPRKQKLQFQVQHRFEDYNLPDRRHVVQLITAYFYSF